MFPLRQKLGLSILVLLIIFACSLVQSGCGGSSTSNGGTGGNTGGDGDGSNEGVGTAPEQASFAYGTFGPAVVGGRITSDGKIVDVPMTTDPESGDTGFFTGTGGFVTSIASDPKGRFVYTLDVQTSSFGIPIGENGIGAFSINRNTGELTRIAGSPYPVTFRGGSVSMDGNALFLFVAANKGNTIDTYLIDQSTGALTKSSTATDSAGDQLVVSWDGRFLFDAGNGQISAYSIAPGTGALAKVSTATTDNTGPLFLSYSGKFLYSMSNFGVTAISVANDGQLAVTQASFPVAQVAGGLPPRLIATSRDDRFAYIGNSSGENVGAVQAFTVDPNTGALGTPVGAPVTLDVGQSPLQVTLDYSGKFLFATFTGINLQTFPINSDGSVGPPTDNPGVSTSVDFFELSP